MRGFSVFLVMVLVISPMSGYTAERNLCEQAIEKLTEKGAKGLSLAGKGLREFLKVNYYPYVHGGEVVREFLRRPAEERTKENFLKDMVNVLKKNKWHAMLFALAATVGVIANRDVTVNPDDVEHFKVEPLAEDSGTINVYDGDLGEQAQAIINKKCKSCHEESGMDDTFLSEVLSDPKKLKEVLRRVHSSEGDVMPPEDGTPLTDHEKDTLAKWAEEVESRSQGPKVVNCSEIPKPEVSVERGQEVAKNSCVVCHGQVSLPMPGLNPLKQVANAASLSRSIHSRFFNNDGSINWASMGDPSEIDGSRGERGTSSIGRLKNQVSGHYMPIEVGPLFGMEEEERKDLLSWLNYSQRMIECRPDSWSTFKGGAMGFSGAAAQCQAIGKKLPSIAQARMLQTQFKAKFGENACVWSMSFNGGSQSSGRLSLGNSSSGDCYAVCVP